MNIRMISVDNLRDMVAEMERMTEEGSWDPAVRQLVERATVNKPDPAVAIFNFIEKTFPYLADPVDVELLIHPRRVAEDYFSGTIRGFDCDDYSMITASMMRNAGYLARIIIMDSDFDWEYDHAIAQIYSPVRGIWIDADTSGNLPLGWHIPSARRMAI